MLFRRVIALGCLASGVTLSSWAAACDQCRKSSCKCCDNSGLLDIADSVFGQIQKNTQKALHAAIPRKTKGACDCQGKPSCGCESKPTCGCETQPSCGCESSCCSSPANTSVPLGQADIPAPRISPSKNQPQLLIQTPGSRQSIGDTPQANRPGPDRGNSRRIGDSTPDNTPQFPSISPPTPADQTSPGLRTIPPRAPESTPAPLPDYEVNPFQDDAAPTRKVPAKAIQYQKNRYRIENKPIRTYGETYDPQASKGIELRFHDAEPVAIEQASLSSIGSSRNRDGRNLGAVREQSQRVYATPRQTVEQLPTAAPQVIPASASKPLRPVPTSSRRTAAESPEFHNPLRK